jgi:hypothetical protein
MRDGWLDLAPVSGKPLGGEEWYFMTSDMPYIVSNAVGTHDNVLTVIHESGHAIHDYLSRHRHDLIWNGGAPDEFAELAANAMIFLADPYLECESGGFIPPSRRTRRAPITSPIMFASCCGSAWSMPSSTGFYRLARGPNRG